MYISFIHAYINTVRTHIRILVGQQYFTNVFDDLISTSTCVVVIVSQTRHLPQATYLDRLHTRLL